MTILVVANESSVLAAIRSGLLPKDVLGAPARVGRDGDKLFVKLSSTLDDRAQAALEESGVSTRRRWPERLRHEELASFAEAIPLIPRPDPAPPFPSLVFHRPKEGFLSLVQQLLRLGCDEMELRFFTDDAGLAHCLLRATNPPYYVVLEALDRGTSTVAYRSVDPRGAVFVPLGWDHPLAQDLAAPPGQMVLARAGAPWVRLPEGSWAPLERHLDVVPPEAERWTESEETERLRVELRLARSSRLRDTDLWVLRRQAEPQLDALLMTLPADVLSKLAFARLKSDGASIIAIRARRLAGAPPALPLADAETYGSLPRIENLHLPNGATLAPPIRASRLRRILAPDPEELVWAVPLEGGTFRVERAAESAFRPMSDWVDHVAAADAGVLEGWIANASFLELESFVALDAEWATAPSEAGPRAKRRERRREPTRETAPAAEATEPRAPSHAPAIALQPGGAPLDPSEAAAEIERLERRFCELDAAADDPERIAIWLELAPLYDASGRAAAAALAWTHALWEAPADARPGIAWRWAEASGAGADLPRSPSRAEVSAVAAHLVARGHEGAPFSELEPLGRALEAHDVLLDCRTLWLVRERLFESSGDPLARVQAQDAVLARLRGGLPVEEVPGFIRLWGSDRSATGAIALLTEALDRTTLIYRDVIRERSAVESDPELTDGYVELLFAWGYARLGQRERADTCVALADALHRAAELAPEEPVHRFLRAAFRARVRQAIEGLPIETPLPFDVAALLDGLDRIERYKVDRLREASTILDWTHGLDPFVAYRRAASPSIYAALEDATPEGVAALAAARLEVASTADELRAVLTLLRVLPEHLVVPALRGLVARIEAVDEEERLGVLEDATLLAARCESAEAFDALLGLFQALSGSSEHDVGVGRTLGRLGGCLHRAGRTEVAAAIVETTMGRLEGPAPEAVLARLELASGLARMGRPDRLDACLTDAVAIPDARLTPRLRLRLVREVALSLGHTSPSRAVSGVASLMQRLPGITDSFNTNSHYCLSVLHFMESMVSGLASRDLSLTPFATRFIEADEHRIRRRIFAINEPAGR